MKTMAEQDLLSKEHELENLLSREDKIMVAFSGGVDSTFLLFKAINVLGASNVLAVTSISELITKDEQQEAQNLATQFGARHELLKTEELSLLEFATNSPQRCYYCKKELYSKLFELGKKRGIETIVDGSNSDDDNDYRPGLKATREMGVRSPLKEAGLNKSDVRNLSWQYNLPTWNKPAAACLASRFPYGEKLEEGKIKKVEQSEKILKQMGFVNDLRVRFHGELARIEISENEFDSLLDKREEIIKELGKIGFKYITLDMQGFVSGSMNRTLDNSQ